LPRVRLRSGYAADCGTVRQLICIIATPVPGPIGSTRSRAASYKDSAASRDNISDECYSAPRWPFIRPSGVLRSSEIRESVCWSVGLFVRDACCNVSRSTCISTIFMKFDTGVQRLNLNRNNPYFCDIRRLRLPRYCDPPCLFVSLFVCLFVNIRLAGGWAINIAVALRGPGVDCAIGPYKRFRRRRQGRGI